jgi:hypothetical protein
MTMAEPIIYPRSESGLKPADSDLFGPLGEIYAFTIHHSAGPRATTKERCQELNRAYQIQHINQRWGDIGYHFCVDDRGRIYKLRPVKWKGAHVGSWNTGNVGIMFHGNFMNTEPTQEMKETLEWLFKGGFYVLTGEPEAGVKVARGHREWPGHNTNACPGNELQASLEYRRNKDFH